MFDEIVSCPDDIPCTYCGKIIRRGENVNIFQWKEKSNIDYYCLYCIGLMGE